MRRTFCGCPHTKPLPVPPPVRIGLRAPVRTRSERAVALLAFVAAMLVLGILALWMATLSGTHATAYLGHYHSSGAFYAAESGGEIVMRELKLGADVSGDGVVGEVSNDGDDGNDPSLSSGSFHVSSGSNQYLAAGSWQGYRRVVELTTQ